ncbi:hypothetical protein ACSDR0_48060 [Streptosporangium sp. G11]|uniref:hypothetical protein n=1 Tax=Streptosporangium sp. G11 TaxID=3436926 RepID=UPI003EB6BD0C
MPTDKRKREIRARQASTGESYNAAARALERAAAENVDAPTTRPVALALPYEVRVFTAPTGPGVLMEDSHHTQAWCATPAPAGEIAQALVAWEGPIRRVQVWDHTERMRDPNAAICQVLQVDAEARRPQRPACPPKGSFRYRPAGPGPELAAEPEWLPTAFAPPRYALHAWTPTGRGAGQWHTLAWCENGRMGAASIAAALRVGLEDGPYPWGYLSGPLGEGWPGQPSRERGRACAGLYPDRAPGERHPWCDYTQELDDPYEDGFRAWLTCTLEAGHVDPGSWDYPAGIER